MPRAAAGLSKASKKSKIAKTRASGAFLPLPTYKLTIDGLRSQGLEHEDAVATLSAGLRQANGLPVRKAEAFA